MTDQEQAAITAPLDTEFVIDNLETLKVIADPLRKRLLEEFHKPKTVKEVARVLGTSPSKLYYHVNLLEEHGLLRVTDTRIVSGIIEKQYQVAAGRLRLKAGLLSPSPSGDDEGLNMTLSHMLDATKDSIRRSIYAGLIDVSGEGPKHKKLFMSHMDVTLTPEQAEAFYDRLSALVDEFACADHDSEAKDARVYALNISFFPAADEPIDVDKLDEPE